MYWPKVGFPCIRSFSVFIDLFVDKQLAHCKRSLMKLGAHLDSAPLSRGLAYRLTCEYGGTCGGRKMKSRLVWPLPRADEEYRMPDICLFCRLDLESLGSLFTFITWKTQGFTEVMTTPFGVL